MSIALRRFSIAACLLAALAALAALSGYATGAVAPISVMAGLQGMSLPTAASVLLLATSVTFVALQRDAAAKFFAACAAAVALVVLTSYALLGADDLSGAVQRELFGAALAEKGRMSSATAVSVMLIASASAWRRSRPKLADACAGIAVGVTGIAVMGYAYGVEDLYRIPIFRTMALNTATSLCALALAAMAADPDSGWAAVLERRPDRGEAHPRRLLGLVALTPIVGDLLVKATASGRIGFGAAMAILVATLAAPLAWLALRDGRARMQLDAEGARRAELQANLATELERRLAEKVIELEREVAERGKAEETVHRAQRMEAVGRLTGGIAHDFNNLLQALSGNVAILQRGLPEGDRLRKFADNADKAVRKGAKLTGQLLAFSRSQRLSIRPILLRDAMQEAHELMKHSLGADVMIDLQLPGDSLWGLGDAQQLELALVNLAMNARDAMPDGGVVEISAKATTALAGQEARAVVGISVTDQGEGMQPDVVIRAGEPFFSTKPQGKGTGLGLAQVFGFARQCGGDVRIDSTPGRGTTVEIVLPRSEPEASGDPRLLVVPPVPEPSATKRLIALIDDDDDVRGVLAQSLVDAGFEVTQASDGLSGLQLMESRRPEVAVIDFKMPGLNGAEVARRAQLRWPALPIVFVSGYSDTLALDGIAGATVLRKPFEIDGLRMAVERALDGSRGA